MEIGDNFNMLEYLKSIKELWEAKSVYEKTVASLTKQYNSLGHQKMHKNVEYYEFDEFLRESFTTWLGASIILDLFLWFVCLILNAFFDFPSKWGWNVIEKICVAIFVGIPIILAIIFFLDFILINHELKKEQQHINELRQKAYDQAKYEKDVLQPPILEKINYYKMKIKEVENAINELYNFGIIHKDYQHYNAAVLFYNYIESGRCEDIRECMLKFDNDSEIMRMHEKIDLMNAKFDQLQKTTLHQISSLRRSVESNIGCTRNLIEQSQKQTQSQLDSLEYNVHINTLTTNEYIDELKKLNSD